MMLRTTGAGPVLLVFAFVLRAGVADETWERWADLGRRLAQDGRYPEARDALQRAREQAERLEPADSRLAGVLNNLGAVHLRLDEISEAENCYRRAAAIWEQRGDPESALAPLTNLVGVYVARRQYAAAEALLRENLDRTTQQFGPGHPSTAPILTYAADLALRRRDPAEAAEFAARALEVLRKTRRPGDPELATAIDNLGAIYWTQRRTAEASRLFEEAIAVLESSRQPEHPAWIPALNDYSLLCVERGRYREAEDSLRRSLALAEKTLGPAHSEVAFILEGYARVLRKTGRKSEARKLQARASRIQQDSSRANAIGYTVDLGSLSAFRP